MRHITAFFNLIRWKNISIVIFSKLLIWVCVILPLQDVFGLPLFLNSINFTILCTSTAMLAAAGYIINDYFDIRIDLRNRPEKVIIGKIIKLRWAMIWHSLFNIAGIALAGYLAYKIGHYGLLFIQIITTILLWLYSTHLKKQYISGNVVVALLTALSLFTIACYEPSLYAFFQLKFFIPIGGQLTLNPFIIICIYTFFAFMLTWIREIVKDMEDFKGDAEEGCITMPIKIGLKKTTTFVYILSIATCIPILIAVYEMWVHHWYIMALYLVVGILVPLVWVCYRLAQNTTAVHYERLSKWLKLMMIIGIITLPLYLLRIY